MAEVYSGMAAGQEIEALTFWKDGKGGLRSGNDDDSLGREHRGREGILTKMVKKRRRVYNRGNMRRGSRPRRRWEEIENMFAGNGGVGGGSFLRMRELVRMLGRDGGSSDSDGGASVASEGADTEAAMSVKDEMERLAKEVEEEGRRRFVDKWGFDISGEGSPVRDEELREEREGAKWIWEKVESKGR